MIRKEVLEFLREDVRVICDDGESIEGYFGSYDESYDFDDEIARLNIWRDGTVWSSVLIDEPEVISIERMHEA